MADTFRAISDPNGNLQFEALLEQVCGVASVYGGVQQDAQDLLDLVGGGEVLLWDFDPKTATPDLAIVRQGNHYYLWVAGTVNTLQWIGNVTGAIAVHHIDANVNAHGFFWKVAQVLLGLGQRYLPPLAPDLRITLVGHSMGGACAYALWYMIRSLYPAYQVELLQISSPKLFTRGLKNPSPGVHFRVRVPGDPIPMLPPNANELFAINPLLGAAMVFSQGLGWEHYGTGYQLSKAGQLGEDLPESYWDLVPLQWLFGLDVQAHLIKNIAGYIREGIEDPYPVTPRARKVLSLLEDVAARPPQENQSIPFDPGPAVDPATSNEAWFGSPSGPITQANADRAQTLSVLVTSSQFSTGSNILGLFGVNMGASGLWKITAYLKGENYGKGTSVVYQGVPDINKAVNPARDWAKQVARTMGNAGSPGALQGGPTDATPRVSYIRITDAKNPRIGMLIQIPPTDFAFAGPPGGSLNDNSADFSATALSMRMTGFTTDNAKVQGFSNHAILYPPDSVVVEGSVIDLTHVDGNGAPYSQRVTDYQKYLADPSRSLGFCIIDPAEVKKTLKSFAFLNGVWQCTCTAHGYSDGDKIRLTAANAKGFNGTYRIVLVDPNTFGLASGPPAGIAAPTIAKAQRVQLTNGTKLVVFAQFALLPAQLSSPFGLRVSKRNPAKPFVPVSFKRRARRLH